MSRYRVKSSASRAVRGYFAVAILALTACGGSDAPHAAADRAPAAAQAGGPVTIHVTTSSGTPVADVAVSLNGSGFDGRGARTNDEGWVRFADIPAGEASASTYAAGYHAAYHPFIVAPATDTDVTLIVEHVTEATPVVLNSRAVAASDGRSLTVDFDLAVLDEHGRALATLTTADVQMLTPDCAWYPCGYDADFGWMDGYRVRADDEAFRWQVASDQPTPPMAVGLLLEQSADMAAYDPARLRLPAVKAFLESILPPDTVSLATYRGTGDRVDLTSYGAFTSDGAQFASAVDALAGQETGSNPFACAVPEMLSLTATQAPSGPDDPLPTVVVVASGSWAGLACVQVGAASTDGIPVVTIGGGDLGAAIAAGTGGSSVVLYHPLQFDVALRNLPPIVGRTLDSNHLRFVLTSGSRQLFRPGRQSVWAYLYVRIGPHTRVEVPLVMPVQ
ncbi:MAG TPA: carboxypeptidase-like regulatory domain-containing protein [Steroidobacteraceae bacterium]|nr:carboxypeptidase-like regulatory domain-containing protein [Steroidobacteraceae bacterium]